MATGIAIEGFDEWIAGIKAEANKIAGAAAVGLYSEGLRVIANSIRRVPVDTGRLRATAYCEPPARDMEGQITVRLGYGTDYAIPVHERTEVRHPVGEAKFLEHAIDENLQGFGERLCERIKENLANGFYEDAILSSEFPTSPQDPGKQTRAGSTLERGSNGRKKWTGGEKRKRSRGGKGRGKK